VLNWRYLRVEALFIWINWYVSLVSDNPTQAHALLDEAIEGWPADRFRFLHLLNEFARVQIHLYQQDYQAASQAIDQYWKNARRSNLFRFEVNRIFVLEIRGRCAAARLGNINRVRDQRISLRVIKQLREEKAAWARPMAHKIRAVVELKKQNFKAAETALLAARDGFKQCNMRHYQYTAEAKLCEISGQLETERFQKVRDWFDRHEVKNRQAFVEMHYPTWD